MHFAKNIGPLKAIEIYCQIEKSSLGQWGIQKYVSNTILLIIRIPDEQDPIVLPFIEFRGGKEINFNKVNTTNLKVTKEKGRGPRENMQSSASMLWKVRILLGK